MVTSIPFMAYMEKADPSTGRRFGARYFHFPTTGVMGLKKAILQAICDYQLPLRENVGWYQSTQIYNYETVLRLCKGNFLAPDQVHTFTT